MTDAPDEGLFVTFSAKLRPAMAEALSKEAAEIGISRMALIQVILHEHLKENAVASELGATLERGEFIVGVDDVYGRNRGFRRRLQAPGFAPGERGELPRG